MSFGSSPMNERLTFCPPGGPTGYCVIGDPSKTNLWILSRTPTLEDYVYEKLVAQLEWQGYDVSKLVVTPQSEDLSAYKDENDDFY